MSAPRWRKDCCGSSDGSARGVVGTIGERIKTLNLKSKSKEDNAHTRV